MVLDGAVDPKQNYIQGSESQAKGFERAFTNFSAWCRQAPDKCPIAPDARTAVTQAMADAAQHPVKGTDGRDATAGWIFLAVISSLYTESGWTALANAIATLRQGNAKGVFTLGDQYAQRKANGSYSNLFDANMAVNCADTDGAPTVDEVRRLQGEWRTKYPLFGAPLAVGMLPCTFWPGTRDPYPAGAATGAPPIVVVGTTGDPATPYAQSVSLAEQLDSGVLVSRDGTATPGSNRRNRRVDGAIERYLVGGTVPKDKKLSC